MRRFTTSDLYVSSVLLTHFQSPFPRCQSNGSRKLFVFELDETDALPVVQAFYDGQLQVNALALVRSIKDLKAAVHQ